MSLDERRDFASYPDLNIKYVKQFTRKASWFAWLFGFKGITNNRQLDNNQTVYVCNHGPTLWGILDVMIFLDQWYNKSSRNDPVYIVSEDFVFSLPLIGRVAAKIGLRRPNVEVLDRILASGSTLMIPAGGNFDLGKPFWMKNMPILKGIIWRNGHRRIIHHNWFVKIASSHQVPIRPIVISGTTEMVPILFVSEHLYRLLGFSRFRKIQAAPGYPVTLNHIVNITLFSILFPSASPAWWAVFLLANIYFDPLFTYPIIWRSITGDIGKSLTVDHSVVLGRSVTKSQDEKNYIIEQAMRSMSQLLVNLEKERRDIFSWAWHWLPLRKCLWEKILFYMQSSYLKRYDIDRSRFYG